MVNREDTKRHIKSIIRQLEDIEYDLKVSRNLGIFDILGGGTITSLFKTHNIGNAQSKINNLEEDLRLLERELMELDSSTNLDLNISGLLKFFDIFADHSLIDIFTQMKISDGRERVVKLKRELEDLYYEL